jgi:NAD(P)H-flavin reductase
VGGGGGGGGGGDDDGRTEDGFEREQALIQGPEAMLRFIIRTKILYCCGELVNTRLFKFNHSSKTARQASPSIQKIELKN